jgi:hypothetical protein
VRKISSLLIAHAECFHPDAEELYRYAVDGQDPEGEVSAHLEQCSECRDLAEVVREMIAVGARPAVSGPSMPAALVRQVEQLHARSDRAGEADGAFSRIVEFLKRPFRVPILALGTAAAVAVVAVLVVPRWHALKEVPHPAALPPQETSLPLDRPKGEDSKVAPPALPEEAPARAAESRKMKHSEVSRRVPSLPDRLEERDERERAGAGGYAYAPAPTGSLREEAVPEPGELPATAPQKAMSSPARGRAGYQAPKPVAALPQATPPAVHQRTVLLRIEGPEGRLLPALVSAIPEELRAKYNFVHETGDKTPSTKEDALKPSLKKKSEVGRAELLSGPIQIIIKIKPIESGYTVEGRIFEKSSRQSPKTITDLDIPIDKLPEEIGRLVRDLLAGP